MYRVPVEDQNEESATVCVPVKRLYLLLVEEGVVLSEVRGGDDDARGKGIQAELVSFTLPLVGELVPYVLGHEGLQEHHELVEGSGLVLRQHK